MNPAIVGNSSLTHFDALIIGSGAGGSSVAAILTKFGKKVLVLEAGPNFFQGLDNPASGNPVPDFANDEVKLERRYFILSDPIVEPRSFRASASAGKRTFVGNVNDLPKTVGGAAVHADVKTPRFQPTDFQLGTLLGQVPGASFADWPVGYTELEPFYGYAEDAIGVQGQAGVDPNAGPRSKPYPMPPGVPMYLALKMVEGAKKKGYTAFPFPTAVNSRPRNGRPACVDCGFCGDYGCPSNAKGSPAVTLLRTALLSKNCQLRPETKAIKLLLSSTKKEVTGVVVIGADGKKQTLTADRYVLAASAIEDVRLLLLSGSGVGNSSGLVGRNLMFHLQTMALGIFEERLHNMRGRSATHAITDFRGVPGDPKRPLGGVVELGGASGPITEAITYVDNLTPFGPRLKAMLRQSPYRDRSTVLLMQGEDAPQPTNMADLDPDLVDLDGVPVARVTYKNHAFELSARKFYSPKLLDILQASGAKYAFVAPQDSIPSSAHIIGTLRFGKDPKASVCDPTGRFHDIGNLYAADSSLFPTSSGYNPILTIVTLASYVAGEMVFPGSPEKAIQ